MEKGLSTGAARRKNKIGRGIAALVIFLFAAQSLQAAEVSVRGIRIGGDVKLTRFVIDLDHRVAFSHLLLADPYRVVIDLPEAEWEIGLRGVASGKGLIGQYRYGLFRPGVSRLVLDLNGPAEIKKIFHLDPSGKYGDRLVVDLVPTSRANFVKAVERTRKARIPIAQPEKRKAAQVPKPTSGKRVIIVDAGHGGVDPGALSVIGVPEKRIALAVAKEIQRALQRNSDYVVLMTRDRDIFVSLPKRVEFARQAEADLFLSVHADSIKNPRVSGATVYTLSEKASDKEAATLARKENRSDLIAGLDLKGETDQVTSILIDLAQRETMNYSARFANFLVPELKRRVTMRSNSHRFAGFKVLKAPDVPSTLMEIGYLSNREDARRLNSREGREGIAVAVVAAVAQYFTSVAAEGF
jgi:N-acetylmuramoyl-L-alanine amidase